MKVHWIHLKNFRGVEDRRIDFAETGVTVVEGANEAGKSSMIEALFLLLDTPDSSAKSDVRSVRPVHTGKSPEVSAEISAGAYRFVYVKCWGPKDRRTLLTVNAPGKEQLQGAAAHDRVVQILGQNADQTLWKALRLQQGVELRQEQLLVGRSLGAALDAAAGGTLSDDRDNTLFKKVEDEYLRWFTPGRGDERPATRAKRALVAEAECRRFDFDGRIAAMEADADRATAVARSLSVLAAGLSEAEASLTGLEAEWRATTEQRAVVDALRVKRDLATANFDAAREARATRGALVEAVAIADAELSTLSTKRDRALSSDGTVGEAVAAAERAAEGARTASIEGVALHQLRGDDVDHLRDRHDLETMSERAAHAAGAQRVVTQAEAFLETCLVDAPLVKRLDQAEKLVIGARSALEAGSPVVTVTARAAAEFAVDGAAFRLAAGESRSLAPSPRTVVRIAELAEVTVTASQEAAGLRDRLAAAQRGYTDICREAGVADIAAARDVLEQRRTQEIALADARTRMGENLRDLTAESLDAKIFRTREKVDSYSATRRATEPVPSTLDDARRSLAEADAAMKAAASVLRQKETVLADVRVGADKVRQDAAGATARVEAAVATLTAARTTVASARLLANDDLLDGDVRARRESAQKAIDAFEGANSLLVASDPESVEARLDAARATVERYRADLDGQRLERERLQATLSMRGEEGLADKLAEAEGAVAVATRDLESDLRRAAAAMLLFATLSHHRDETRRAYVRPFKEKLESFGRIVFGSSFSVEISPVLQIEKRTLNNVTVDFKELSTGAREQLGVLARLACASVVSPQGGVPLILDDALGWSDPDRLAGVTAALNAGSKQCQVIILTCMPQRYQGIGSATVVRI